MASITILFRDGTKKEFPHVGRGGGSYTKSVSCANGFVVVKDEWGEEIFFPSDLVAEVKSTPESYR